MNDFFAFLFTCKNALNENYFPRQDSWRKIDRSGGLLDTNWMILGGQIMRHSWGTAFLLTVGALASSSQLGHRPPLQSWGTGLLLTVGAPASSSQLGHRHPPHSWGTGILLTVGAPASSSQLGHRPPPHSWGTGLLRTVGASASPSKLGHRPPPHSWGTGLLLTVRTPASSSQFRAKQKHAQETKHIPCLITLMYVFIYQKQIFEFTSWGLGDGGYKMWFIMV